MLYSILACHFVALNSGRKATIKLNDGIETPIYLQGNGVQRAFIFALIEVLAKQLSQIVVRNGEEQHTRPTILLFEEPELFLHPHLMRRLKLALENISKRENWQVIITTHSPFLIDVAEDPTSLVILKKNTDNELSLTQLSEDPFSTEDLSQRNDKEALRAALDFHPTVTEAFFAKRVILVEGDTEIAVFQNSKKLLPFIGLDGSLFDHTTFVSCGGKWTIPGMAKLLKKYNIPFRVIHDQDRHNFSDEELSNLPQLHPYNANERIRRTVEDNNNIFMVNDTFEHIFNETNPISNSSKPYKAWIKINEISQENINQYPRLIEILRFAFNWE